MSVIVVSPDDVYMVIEIIYQENLVVSTLFLNYMVGWQIAYNGIVW